MQKRITFPFFNALICALLGGLVGYYGFRFWEGAGIAAAAGLALGLGFEWGFGLAGVGSWLYQRRVLALTLLEVPLTIFFAGPYGLMWLQVAPDPHVICCGIPTDFGAAVYEDFRLEVDEGVTLAGWYVPPAETPGPVVVLLHGSRSDRLDTRWHAEQLIRAGYGILMYDQRGLGESTGNKVTVGWEDGGDLVAAADWLAAWPGVDADRIGVVGLSLGAQVALNAAHEDQAAFAALWLDGTQAQTETDLPMAENAGERFATFMNRILFNILELHLGRPAPPPFKEILPGLTGPHIVMVAAGADDVERRINAGYVPLMGPNFEYWLIEGAGHLGGPSLIPEAYAGRMLAFFDGVLRP